jgi:hypothetical protein
MFVVKSSQRDVYFDNSIQGRWVHAISSEQGEVPGLRRRWCAGEKPSAPARTGSA